MKRLPLCFPSEVSSRGTRDVGIMDLLSGLLVVKQILKLWPEKGFGWRQTSFLFFKSNSSRFPYIFRLLDFFFDTEYYAILMSNSKCVFDNLSHTQVQSLRDLATHP